jgi:uncharacterized tellurite resistance protein B-like protein
MAKRGRRGGNARRRPGRRSVARATRPLSRLSLDEAFIALFIGVMAANGHVSPEELARVHHLVWSMKRFRRKSGETVGRLIEEMKRFVAGAGPAPAVRAAAAVIPNRLRPAAFAVSADLVLADGKIERAEARLLRRLAEELRLDRLTRDRLLNAMRIKNSA